MTRAALRRSLLDAGLQGAEILRRRPVRTHRIPRSIRRRRITTISLDDPATDRSARRPSERPRL
jgi:hypothetical protein